MPGPRSSECRSVTTRRYVTDLRRDVFGWPPAVHSISSVSTGKTRSPGLPGAGCMHSGFLLGGSWQEAVVVFGFKSHKIWETEAASTEGTVASGNGQPQPGRSLSARMPTLCGPGDASPSGREWHTASLIVGSVWVTLATRRVLLGQGCWRETRRKWWEVGPGPTLGPALPAGRSPWWRSW